ncbi:hypothetical protein [Streptosporangium amethystogenes]|uniref:hypothetical protein n=1 Tax=Streptosporangium amethystogenes TaxID=2002 RepID=UPI001B80E226|nr:hypothetical protein [Streptosporangium amethystogenes]
MHYDVVRQLSRPGEVLQQHVVHVATRNGMRGEAHAAVYFRFDEYANFISVGQDG